MMYTALVDCNNFYVSCERAFAPAIAAMPVVVLSNNDGCVVSRSSEAKALGVTMGQPYHEIRDLVRKKIIRCFSSNYVLYGDLSRRVMETLERFAPLVEMYSIDEAFLSLQETINSGSVIDQAKTIREAVRRWTGIPVSIGLSSTKTLAKIAGELSKKHPDGVVDLRQEAVEDILAATPIEHVWGVGRRLGKSLRRKGIVTALGLRNVDDRWGRTYLNVVQRRTVMELRGIPCIQLSGVVQSRQSLVCTRSFGRKVKEKELLFEAIASFAAQIGTKLRKRGLAASHMYVFASATGTERWRADRRESLSASCSLPTSTSYTPDLIRYAHALLEECYLKETLYYRAGVVVHGLVPESSIQTNLFASADHIQEKTILMEAMDKINRRWGKEVVSVAATGTRREWQMKQENLSPRYTTDWKDIQRIEPPQLRDQPLKLLTGECNANH